MTPEEIKALPKYVGIVADLHYQRKDVIRYIISELQSKSVVVLPSGGGFEEAIRKDVLLRGNLHLREFSVTEAELRYLKFSKAQSISDKLFLAFIKEVKGHLFIFPHRYRSDKGGTDIHYAKRMQDMIIHAYTSDIKHTVVYAEDVE